MANLIAEIGCEHGGSVDEFKRIADAVHAVPGVRFIKWQMYLTDSLVSRHHDPEHYKMLEALEWSLNQHQEAKAHVDALPGVKPLVSVFSPDAVELAAALKFVNLKIGSGELTDERTVRAAARRVAATRGWLFVSTGMGTPKEIHRAGGWVAEEGNDAGTVWLACTSAYPCEEEAAHVRRVEWLMDHVASRDDLVGYSDHTKGALVAQMAVALGAQWVEKHVTLGKGPDANVALTPEQFEDWAAQVQLAKDTLGSRTPRRLKCEIDTWRKARKSRYMARRRDAGDVMDDDDFVWLRPNLEGR